ncbi:MAG: hypothetical protein RLY30_808, partial [Pseudomonadota bacterium]
MSSTAQQSPRQNPRAQASAGGDAQLYARLLGYARPYWRIAVVSVLAMMVSAALEPALPALMQPLVDESLIAKDPASLWRVPLLIALVFVVKGLADYLANVAAQTVAHKTMADLRQRIFEHELALPLPRHAREEGGRMLSRITYEVAQVSEAVSTAWIILIRDSLVLVGLMGFLFYTAWELTLLVLGLAPVLALAIRLINQRLRRSSERVQTFMGRLTGRVEGALQGLQEIKLFGAHRAQAQGFSEVNEALRREQIRVSRVQSLNVPLVQALAALSVALVILLASQLSQQNLLTPGEFVAFITAMSMVFEPVRRLTNVNATLQKGLAAAEGLFELLDERAEGECPGASDAYIVPRAEGPSSPYLKSPTGPSARGTQAGDSQGPAPLPELRDGALSANPPLPGRQAGDAQEGDGGCPEPGVHLGGRADLGFGGETPQMHISHTAPLAITFDRVSYTYPLANKSALSDFSLQVATGETVALVGPSGSGKSTLLYLLAGFDAPSQGEICLFNRPIQTLSLDALRAQLAVVGQRVVLFDQTVRQNIALGQPHAMLPVEAWSPEQRIALDAAVEAAHAQDFIRQLPQGLDTPMGALGGRLSGGQR